MNQLILVISVLALLLGTVTLSFVLSFKKELQRVNDRADYWAHKYFAGLEKD